MINDYPNRHIPFQGCFNFRDIGGYPAMDGTSVRWGRYFRAGRQDRMTDADLEQLKRLGVKTQIDLRKPDEAAEQSRGPLPDLGAQYHNIPVIPEGGSDQLSKLVGDTGISGKRYLGYLEFGPETWHRIFDIFASADDHPIVLHCTAGKDRTGVSTAFLLATLGVDRSWIEADYILTNRDVPRQVDFVEEHVGLPDGMDRDALSIAAGVPENAMADFLDGLEARWGGTMEYLREIGIKEETFERVRHAFLDR
ncbi:MAG: tyrosine-protein phosphatase [Pseudomonadaceae bacterium]|nr:tyrosine-protein phosphatase [Pseudomonadaceae bacterium]